ncbi:MAG TPA: shikimate dehydrogenase [Vicinamibacterales bacterium]|nr:shikimate dehydrogenase [Vicinamibacterales bacterium]
MSKLCVTVTGRTMAELRQHRDEVAGADIVELRVDTVADPSAAAALAGRRTPVIFTCRPRWEGGQFEGSEDQRRRLLREALELGAEYIDVEWKAGFAELLEQRRGQGIVLSMHDFEGVPGDLASRAAAMRATGAEVIKLAVMAHRLGDCLPLWAIGQASTAPTALVAMGDAGVATRVLARRFQSCWTYAGDGVAPGQLSFTRLRDEFSFRSLGERTAVYGVVGRPVMHSVSPAMHNAAFKAAQLDAVYVPLAAADFDDFLAFADTLAVAGVSVTAPFKLEAFRRAGECDPLSCRIQSVNTLRRSGDGWIGFNSDVTGFLAPLQARMTLEGSRATILGAGGAARAAAEALNGVGASVSIAARRRDRAEEVAALVGCSVAAWPPAAGSWDILVNATPAGTAPAVTGTPLPDGPFTGQLVYDLVYNPLETTLLSAARAAGCRTLGGLDMLVAQAQRQFEWWTGLKPSERVMRGAALAALALQVPDVPDVPNVPNVPKVL